MKIDPSNSPSVMTVHKIIHPIEIEVKWPRQCQCPAISHLLVYGQLLYRSNRNNGQVVVMVAVLYWSSTKMGELSEIFVSFYFFFIWLKCTNDFHFKLKKNAPFSWAIIAVLFKY